MNKNLNSNFTNIKVYDDPYKNFTIFYNRLKKYNKGTINSNMIVNSAIKNI